MPDYTIWTAGDGRYDILTMLEDKGWKVVVEDVLAGSELMRYVACDASGWEAAVGATKYLPGGATVDQPAPDDVKARWTEEAEAASASVGFRH